MTTIRFKILFFSSLIIFFISCGQTYTKSPLIDGLANGDTLTLFAEYAECGEWGGHIEKIFVINKDNTLWTAFYSDTISCPMEVVTRKIKVEKSKALSTDDRNIIAGYIEKIIRASKNKEIPESNSLYYFKLITKEQRYEYNNWKKDWKEFQNMRAKIF